MDGIIKEPKPGVSRSFLDLRTLIMALDPFLLLREFTRPVNCRFPSVITNFSQVGLVMYEAQVDLTNFFYHFFQVPRNISEWWFSRFHQRLFFSNFYSCCNRIPKNSKHLHEQLKMNKQMVNFKNTPSNKHLLFNENQIKMRNEYPTIILVI